MKSNITLIGMPGAGKSTVGIILAKHLSYGFIDTDVLIQIHEQKSLQEIIEDSDYLNLRHVEEATILKINVSSHVLATGGSAVYSKQAMTHLKHISLVVFLEVTFDEILRRIHNFETRGIARARGQSFRDLYNERQSLYSSYADITVDGNSNRQEELAEVIASEFYNSQ